MPRKITKGFDAWSYSRLNDYRRCPFAAKLKHIDKKKVPPGPALARGIQLHEMLERIATGLSTTKIREWSWIIDKVRRATKGKEIDTEIQWAFDRAWRPAEWFGPTTWCRVVADLIVYRKTSALIVDYKSGKVRPEEVNEQLSLYALSTFLKIPGLKTVDTQAWYSDHKEVVKRTYKPTDVTELRNYWTTETIKMFADRKFAPKPGGYCRWCTFSKEAGGPCRF